MTQINYYGVGSASCMIEINWYGLRSVTFFLCVFGSFDPLCVRSSLDTLESGVLFHILWAVETFTCFTRQFIMESGVVSSLPDHAFTTTLESMGWNDQL